MAIYDVILPSLIKPVHVPHQVWFSPHKTTAKAHRNMAGITTILEFIIAVISAYSLYHSASSIPKLQKYETKAEKAAEWSQTAEKQLWDTRYTVGAGCIAVSPQRDSEKQR